MAILQPLDEKFAIVGSDGRPTLYFIKWAQQRQIDINQGLTLADLVDYLQAHKLIEGVGIQLSNGGDISQGVTISADVQEILDTLSATRGTIIYRGLLGWTVLLPGTAGYVLSTNGPGADPSWIAAGGGGGGYPYEIAPTKPLAANFTVQNGGVGVTFADKTGGLWLDKSAAANAQMTMAQSNTAPPVGDFTITARLRGTNPRAGGGYHSGIMLRNSSNGRIVYFGHYNTGQSYLVQNWTSYSAFSANVIAPASWYELANLPWLRITKIAGVLEFWISADGDAWTTLGTTATVASFLTAAGGALDQVGFGNFSNLNGTLCSSWTVV